MDKENVVHVHNGALISHKEEWNYVTCKDIDGTGNHVEQDKSNSERQIYFQSYAESRSKKNDVTRLQRKKCLRVGIRRREWGKGQFDGRVNMIKLHYMYVWK
jgi:hypothetical protein